MYNKSVLFITANNIFDSYGNGGVKASQENYKLVEGYFGKENTYTCIFMTGVDTEYYQNTLILPRVNSKLSKLVSSLLGFKIYMPWEEKKIKKLIEKVNPNLVFIDGSMLGRLVKIKGNYKSIVFYHNVEGDYAWNKVENQGLQFLPSYFAAKYNDKCATIADGIICFNNRDSKRIYSLYNRKVDFLLPVTFADNFDEHKTIRDYKKEILFLGSLFEPNKISIEWFIKNVMPQLDGIKLNIVGKDFERMKNEYEKNKNVHVIGSVKETDIYYYRHAAVVLPIQYGAGMKVKTAEAMMYGRTIFASDEALEGYDVEGVESIIRCNTAEEYVISIKKYFNQGNYEPYQKSVRELYLKNYEINCMKEKFNNFVSQLLD